MCLWIGNMVTRVGSSAIFNESMIGGNLAVMASSVVMTLVVMAVIYHDDLMYLRMLSKLCQETYNRGKEIYLLRMSLLN